MCFFIERHRFVILSNALVKALLPLLVRDFILLNLLAEFSVKLRIIIRGNILIPNSILLVRVNLISEIDIIKIRVVIAIIRCVISAGSIITLVKPLVVAVHITCVVLLFLTAEKSVLIVHLLTFHLISVKRHSVKLGDNLIELRQILLICLISGCRCVRAAISSRHSRRLTHSVLHSQLTTTSILLRILLIERILVEVIAEFLSVKDLIDNTIYLRLPLRLIRAGLCSLYSFKRSVCLLHSLARGVFIVRVFLVFGYIGISYLRRSCFSPVSSRSRAGVGFCPNNPGGSIRRSTSRRILIREFHKLPGVTGFHGECFIFCLIVYKVIFERFFSRHFLPPF